MHPCSVYDFGMRIDLGQINFFGMPSCLCVKHPGTGAASGGNNDDSPIQKSNPKENFSVWDVKVRLFPLFVRS